MTRARLDTLSREFDSLTDGLYTHELMADWACANVPELLTALEDCILNMEEDDL